MEISTFLTFINVNVNRGVSRKESNQKSRGYLTNLLETNEGWCANCVNMDANIELHSVKINPSQLNRSQYDSGSDEDDPYLTSTRT